MPSPYLRLMELPAPLKTAIQSRRTKVAGEALIVVGLIKPAIALGRAAIGVVSELQTVVDVGRWLYHAPPLWLNGALVAVGGLLLYVSRRVRPQYIHATARKVDNSDREVEIQPPDTGAAHSEIRFEYLPASPLNNGWHVAYLDRRVGPENRAAVEASWRTRQWRTAPNCPVEGSILIEIDNGAIDYTITSPSARLSERMEFDAHYIDDSAMLFAEVFLTSRDGRDTKTKFIKFLLGRNLPYPTPGYAESEYTVEIDAAPYEKEWCGFVVSLADETKRSWGREGWQYAGLKTIRVRGRIGISPIKLFARRT